MIRAFVAAPGGGLRPLSDLDALATPSAAPGEPPVWVDLVAPTEAERASVSERFSIAIPSEATLRAEQGASRLEAHDSALQMTFRTLPDRAGSLEERAVWCCLTPRTLVTMRCDLAVGFDTARSRPAHPKSRPADPRDVLLGILDAQVDRITEYLEALGRDIDSSMSQVFFAGTRARRSSQVLRDFIHEFGRQGTRIASAEDSLISLERLFLFLSHQAEHPALAPGADAAQGEAQGEADRQHRAREIILGEVRALGETARGLDSRVNFLLSAALGFVGVDQNQVMKTISLIAALFLPGTLIASIFGMNFADMPAIRWHYGFMAAIGASVLTALALAALFRWLRWM